MILLACRHGLRASEVCGLKLAAVDVKGGSISLQRLKGSLKTVQPLYRHRGQSLLDEVAVVKAGSANTPKTARAICSRRRRADALTAPNFSECSRRSPRQPGLSQPRGGSFSCARSQTNCTAHSFPRSTRRISSGQVSCL